MLDFAVDVIRPARPAVLQEQGLPAAAAVPAAIESLHAAAMALFERTAEPKGVLQPLGREAFAAIYAGQGRNLARTPVGDIYPRAERLALFAVTLGPAVTREITARFELHDPATGCMLDSIASLAADRLAAAAQRRYLEEVLRAEAGAAGWRALRYSPGYCGWDISAQRRLFEALRPERIGISLRESFLMDPLKSVSGVILVGPREIHEFDTDYPCCGQCQTHGCRERLRSLGADGETGTALE